MTSATGSLSIGSGLLGGVAGSIDTDSLIDKLMQAASIPQSQLKDQLKVEQTSLSAYQAVNSSAAALQTAADEFTDPTGTVWASTSATSSNSAVVATGSATAVPGSTTFSVTALAAAQVGIVTADASGNVLADPSAGLSITGADGTAHQISAKSGSATDVAAAINAADVGVRASVISADGGQTILQLAAAKTGTDSAFSTNGFSMAMSTVTDAADATVAVGDPTNPAYTVSSQSNTFTDFIPGVTFSVNALADNVTVSVAKDGNAISDKVSALVDALNKTTGTISAATAKGAVLQGSYDVTSLQQNLYSSISQGTAGGASLHTYGIDIDSNGTASFDADAFATAYANDPAGTKAAINAFAGTLGTDAGTASDPTSGTLTAAVKSANSQIKNLNDEINDWKTRLASIKDTYTLKFTAMKTALDKLQSQQTYLTSMFDSLNKSSDSSQN
jgi:flagellar hook-associated protein 2